MSTHSRVRNYLSQHLYSTSQLFSPLSQILTGFITQEEEHPPITSQSDHDSTSHACPQIPARTRKVRSVSEYVNFCRYMREKRPGIKNLQSIWKDVKHTDWQSLYEYGEKPITQSSTSQEQEQKQEEKPQKAIYSDSESDSDDPTSRQVSDALYDSALKLIAERSDSDDTD